MLYDKRICKTYSELRNYLEDLGFIFDEVTGDQDHKEEMRWNSSTRCCWICNPTTEQINFIGSNDKMAFPPHNGLRLADFHWNETIEGETVRIEKYCGVIFMELADGGCALYMSPVAKNFSINDLNFCCKPGYKTTDNHDPLTEEEYHYTSTNADLQNGLVVHTAPEADHHWRVSWRYKDSREHKWVIDDTVSNITWGKEIPYVRLIPADLCVTVTKTLLNSGDWSKYIYTQVLGNAYPPNTIFKVGGQKFMSFTDNPPITVKPYDETKAYNIGDLCTYVGQEPFREKKIYKCWFPTDPSSAEGHTVPFSLTNWEERPNDMAYRCPAFKLPPEATSINPSSSTQEYSPLTTYKINDYCIYDNTLYRCIDAVITPEPFDDSKWVVTTVSAEIALL